MRKAFLKVIQENQAIIYKVCNIYRDSVEDKEDLFQEIVLQLWKSYPKYRGEAKLSTWLYRIALNTAMAAYRKKSVFLDYNTKPKLHSESVYWNQMSENEERLYDAIRLLNEADRALVALYLEDYPYKEIAKITGLSSNNVAVKMVRIKEKLKKILNQ